METTRGYRGIIGKTLRLYLAEWKIKWKLLFRGQGLV